MPGDASSDDERTQPASRGSASSSTPKRGARSSTTTSGSIPDRSSAMTSSTPVRSTAAARSSSRAMNTPGSEQTQSIGSPTDSLPSLGSPTAPRSASASATTRGSTARSSADQPGMCQLLQAIYTPDVAMKSTVRGWIRQFESSPKPAILTLINMLVQACGANYTLTEADLEQDTMDIVKQLGLMAQHPLETTAAGNRARSARLIQFLRTLVDECQERLLYEARLGPVLAEWVVCLSASHLRPYRQLMTTVAGVLIQDLIGICLERVRRYDTVKKMWAVEQARPKPSKARLEQFKADESLYMTHTEALDTYILLLVRTFMHRYRDVDPSIRVAAVTHLGSALIAHPTLLLKDKYLRYIAWALSDTSPLVRVAALEACLQIYESPDQSLQSQLSAFTARFLPRFSEMTRDVDSRAAARAINVMTALLKQGILDETKGEDIPRYIWDAEPMVRAAATAFVLEDSFADSPSPGPEDGEGAGGEGEDEAASGSSSGAGGSAGGGNTTLSDAELTQIKEDNIQLLNIFLMYSPLVSGAKFTSQSLQALMDTMVDNFWPKLKCVRHWNSLVDLILLSEGSQRQIQRQRVFVLNEPQTTVAIMMLLSIIRRYITGESASEYASNSASTVSNLDQPQSRDRYQQMRRRRIVTESLCEAMPELLRVFGADPVRVVPLLSIVTCLDPEQYTALRRSAQHAALLTELKQILSRATDGDVIQWTARALHVLSAGAQDALTLAAQSAARELAAELSAQLESALRNAVKLQTRLLRNHEGPDVSPSEKSTSDPNRALPQLTLQQHAALISKLNAAEQRQCAEAGAAVLATARRLEGLAVGCSIENELCAPRAENIRRAVLAAILNEKRPRRADETQGNEDLGLGIPEPGFADSLLDGQRGGSGYSSGSGSSGSGEDSEDSAVVSQPNWRTYPPPLWALGAVGSGTIRSLLRIQQAALLWSVAAVKSEGVREEGAGEAEAAEDAGSGDAPKKRGRKKKLVESDDADRSTLNMSTTTSSSGSSAPAQDDRVRQELVRLRNVLFTDCLRTLKSYSATVTLAVRVTAVSALSEAQTLFSGALEKTPYAILAAPINPVQSHNFLVQTILLLDALAERFEKFQHLSPSDIMADPELLSELEDLGFTDSFDGDLDDEGKINTEEEDYVEAQDAVLTVSPASVLLNSSATQTFLTTLAASSTNPAALASATANAPTPAALAAFSALEKLPAGARRSRALALQVALALAKVALYCPLAQAPGALSALMGLVSRFGEAVDAVVRHVARQLRTREHGAAALLTAQFEALRALFLSLPDEDTTPVEVLANKFVLMHPIKTTARSLAIFHRLVVDFALDQPPSLLAFLPAAIKPFLMRSSIADTRYLATHFARQAHACGLSKLQSQALKSNDPQQIALWKPLDEFARMLAKKGFTFDSRVLIAPELEPGQSVNLSAAKRASSASASGVTKDEEQVRALREAVLRRKKDQELQKEQSKVPEEEEEEQGEDEEEEAPGLGKKRGKPLSSSQPSESSQEPFEALQTSQRGRKSTTTGEAKPTPAKSAPKRRKRGEEEEEEEKESEVTSEEEEESEDEIISQTPPTQRSRASRSSTDSRQVPSLSSSGTRETQMSMSKHISLSPDEIEDVEDDMSVRTSATNASRLSLTRSRR